MRFSAGELVPGLVVVGTVSSRAFPALAAFPTCVWRFGGANPKGTTNSFGGNSTAEYGPLLFSFYPNPNPAVRTRTNNFRNVLSSNPCPA